ncbi:hypothetical protein ACWDE9_46230 [Streptomyces olivaceoviridis]
MSPEHAPRRSQVVLVEPALSQLAKLTAAETHRLDRAIVAIRQITIVAYVEA